MDVSIKIIPQVHTVTKSTTASLPMYGLEGVFPLTAKYPDAEASTLDLVQMQVNMLYTFCSLHFLLAGCP